MGRLLATGCELARARAAEATLAAEAAAVRTADDFLGLCLTRENEGRF